MDPIQQILAQGQMGDKNGGLQQYYFEGQRLGQQQQQINLQQQRLQLEQQHQQKEDALMPYKIEAMQLSNRNEALAVDANLLKARVTTQQNEALPQILQLQSEYLASPLGARDPNLFQKTQALSQQYPFAFVPNTPGGAIVDTLKADVMVQKQWDTIAQAQRSLEGTGQYLKEINPKTGAVTLGATAVDKPPLAATQEIEALMNAAAANDAAQGITKTPAELAQRRLDFTQDKVLPMGSTETITTPDGTSVTRQVGRQSPVKGDSAATQQMKQQTLGLTDTAKQIQTSLIPNLENIYGPKATLGNFVVDKSFANLNPDLAVGQRIAGREAARYLYQGVLRQLNHNQRVNATQEKELKNAFPALEGLAGMHESPADAKVILQQLQKQLARDSYVKQRLLGDKPDTETLQFLDPRFLVDEVKAGRLSEETATSAMSQSPFQDEIKALVKQNAK